QVQAALGQPDGVDMGPSMSDILALQDDADELGLCAPIHAHLHADPARALARSPAALLLPDLADRWSAAPWWSDTWLDDTLGAVPARFDQSMGRWRSLYKAALQQAREQQRIKLSANTKTPGDRKQADRLRREAENQLDLLRAESDNRNQSD